MQGSVLGCPPVPVERCTSRLHCQGYSNLPLEFSLCDVYERCKLPWSSLHNSSLFCGRPFSQSSHGWRAVCGLQREEGRLWKRRRALEKGRGSRDGVLYHSELKCGWKPGEDGTERRSALRARAADESAVEEKVDYKAYQALMRGGEEVIAMMTEMTELLADITEMGDQAEEVAVEMAATGAVGQRLEKLDGSFLMALDWMVQQAEKDGDDKKKWLLGVIKDTVIAQLSQKLPSQVQVVGMLCRTPDKDARQEILRRCAGGGGTFDQTGGGKVMLPGANLKDIADQANDIVSTMEEKPKVPDRRLLARLVLVREEAGSLLSGGLLDERNDHTGLKNLPEPEVNFLTKIVGMKPGPELHKKLANVIGGKEEGADLPYDTKPRQSHRSSGAQEQAQKSTQILPVRPGLFLQTVTKVLGGMYTSNAARGVTVQQLEWIHKETLKILQALAYS